MKVHRIIIQNGAVEKVHWFTRQAAAQIFAREKAADLSPGEEIEIDECRLRPATILAALNKKPVEIAPADVTTTLVFRAPG